MVRSEFMLPALGLTVMLAGGAFLLIRPALKEREALHANIAVLREEIGQPIDEPGLIGALKGEVDRLTRLGESRTTPIPPESDIAGLVRSLSIRLEELGLHDSELTTGIAQDTDGVKAIPVSLHFEGRFLPAVDAIRYIESLPRLIRITRMTMTNPTASRQPGVGEEVEADLMLDVFFDPGAGAGGGA